MVLLVGLTLSLGIDPPEVRLVEVEPLPVADSTAVLIPLNTARAEELELLPGIGPKRAADIVADREANGPYASVDSLQRVRGIGPVTVERIRPLVRVE